MPFGNLFVGISRITTGMGLLVVYETGTPENRALRCLRISFANSI